MPLARVEAIIAEYDIALTIRQIFHRLVERYFYPKTRLAYYNLGELLNKARRARRDGRDRSDRQSSTAEHRSRSPLLATAEEGWRV
jgi:hypothetical protein